MMFAGAVAEACEDGTDILPLAASTDHLRADEEEGSRLEDAEGSCEDKGGFWGQGLPLPFSFVQSNPFGVGETFLS